MNSKSKKIIKTAAVLVSVAAVGVTLGFGCGEGFKPQGSSDNSSFADTPGPSNSGDNGDLNIVANSKTAAVTNFRAALDNMVSMTGTTPSAATLAAFNNNVGSFSETGSILTINAPMLMAYVALGAEVCNDLVAQENALVAANRRVFAQFNFAATNATALRDTDLTDTVIPAGTSDATRRLARLFWQRNETPAELAMINVGVQEILTSTPALPTAAIQRRVGLYICSSMIASTAGYQL